MSNSGQRQSTGSRIYGVVRLVLVTAIFAYLGWGIYEGRDALAILDPDWHAGWIAGAFIAAVAAYQSLVVAWILLLRRTGHYDRSELRSYFRIWWLSYLYRYVPGKLMLVIERARLGADVGIPAVVGGSFAVVEMLLAIVAGSTVALLSISYYASNESVVIVSLAIAAIAGILALPWGFRLLCSLPMIRHRFPELEQLSLSRRDLAVVTLPFIAHYLLLGASFFLIAMQVADLSVSILPGVIGIYALSHVLSLVAVFAPAGLGVREGALAVQLGRVMPTGLSEALAIGARVWFTIVEVICYVVIVLLVPAKRVVAGSPREP